MTSNSHIRGINQSRIARGLGAQGVFQTIQALIRLVEVPLLLSSWGAELYGEWLMVAAIPAYLALGDGGFTGAACREMSMRSGAGDRDGVLSVFQSTWALLLFISAIVALIGLILAYAADFSTWLGLSAISGGDLRVIVYLFTARVIIVFQETLLIGGFWSTGRYPLYMLLSAVTQFLEFSGLAVVLLLGGGALQAAIGFVIGRLSGTILVWGVFKKVCPWIYHGFGSASLEELKRLFAPALASLAFPIGNAFNIQGMRIIVGVVLGPAAVAVFTTLRTLSRFAMQPRVVVNQIVEPELALAFGSGDTRQFRRLFTNSCQIAIWTSITACVVLAVTSKWLYPFWTNSKVEIHWPLYLLLLCTVAVNALWYTALMVPYATNRHGRIALIYGSLYGVCAFVCGYFAIIVFGFVGVGIVLLCIEIIMSVYVIKIAIGQTRISLYEWFRKVIAPPLFLLSYCFKFMRRIKIAQER